MKTNYSANFLTDIQLAHISLKNDLFIINWQMQSYYEEIIEGNTSIGIHVIFHNNMPVASAILELQENWLSVFVKESYRQQKYGQKVVSEILTKYSKKTTEVYGMEGCEASEQFYNSCGIAYFANGVFPMKDNEIELYMNDDIAFETIKQRRINEYWEKKIHSERVYA